jgi:SAM-dependent methyltransferase
VGRNEVSTGSEAAESFADRTFRDASAAVVAVLAALGDKLGIFRELAAHGPATAPDLARRLALNDRYVREWLSAMACAGYVRYDAKARRFTMPEENAAVLVAENGPDFLGGLLEMLPPLFGAFDRIADTVHQGGGFPQSEFGPDFWEGMERFSAAWFENDLVQRWIPAIPEVERKLCAGARMADLGCGRGRAIVKLARTYPKSRCDGYEVFGPAISHARKNAWISGVADRVRFEWRDATEKLLERYDIIATFDSLHDFARPMALLRRIREALAPDGVYLCLETDAADRLEENAGPFGSFYYGLSTLYCLSSALAEGGDGLGAMGLSPERVRKLCSEAGFRMVRRVPVNDGIHALYEIRP